MADRFVLPPFDRQFFGPRAVVEEEDESLTVFSKGDTRYGRIAELEIFVEKEEEKTGGFREVKDETKAKALERQKRKEQTGGVNIPVRGRGGGRGGPGRGAGGRGGPGGRGGGRGTGRGGRGGDSHRPAHHQAIMADTVDISPESHVILHKFDLEKLHKTLKDDAKREEAKGGAIASPVLTVTDLRITGQCREYDSSLDRAAAGARQALSIPLRTFPDVVYGYKPVIEDPTIREIARLIPPGTTPVIVTSDLILAHLMQAPKSIRAWDIETNKLGRFLFLSERESNAGQLDTQWVGETMMNGPIDSADWAEDINSATRLAQEATQVAHFFSSQAQKTKMFPRPGATKSLVVESNQRPCFFRYRHFHMEDCDVLVRCEVDCATETAPGELDFLRVFALLEQPSNMASVTESWRARLGESRGAIMAQEIKCNAAKIARWLTLAWLAGANMKIAFVSRVDPAKNDKHAILGVESKLAVDFAAQIGVRSNQLWKTMRAVLDTVIEKTPADNTQALLVKVAGKPEIIFCQAIEEDDDEDEDDDDDEEDEDDDDEDA